MNKLLIVKKIPIAMRITCLLLCLIVFQLQAEDVYSQKTKISLDMKNTTIEKVLQTIEEKSDYHFLYNNKLVNVDRKVSVRVKNAAIADVLKKLFASEDVEYQVEGNQIILSPKEKVTEIVSGVESAQQQQKIITGKVTDANGEPIIGATILIKGTSQGTVTDMDGNYTLQNVPEDAILQFSYVGMETQEIPVRGKNQIDVIMHEEAVLIDEVVVTALGIEKKEKSLTYSTQIVDGSELSRVKDPNMITSLAGKTSGVQITRSGSGLGGSAKVVIRGNRSTSGSNQPLYVIDGVPINSSSNDWTATTIGGRNDAGNRDGGDGISNLNPDDIESMNILKGPAASALYGSAAANGVILITTKKGRAGRTEITFNSSTTFETPKWGIPKFQNSYGGITTSWGNKIEGSPDYTDQFFKTGVTTINSLSLSSGSDERQTYFSYAHTYAKGVVEKNELKKHNFNFRESANFFDKKIMLDASINLMFQNAKNRLPTGGFYMNPLVGVYRFPRGESPERESFSYYKENYKLYNAERNMDLQNWYTEPSTWEQNPFWLINMTPNNDQRYRTILNLTASWNITDNLELKARGAADFIADDYESKMYAGTCPALTGGNNGRYIVDKSKSFDLYSDLMLTYQKQFEAVSISATLGTSIKEMRGNSAGMDSYPAGLYNPNIFSAGNIDHNGGSPSLDKYREREQAVFFAGQLGLHDWLFLDFTGRNDWTSTLAYTKYLNRGFFYPSIGVTWVMNEALKMPEWINLGKIRAAWSKVGNGLPRYRSMPLNSVGRGGTINYNTTAPFTELKPEMTTSIEAGTEWRLFNSRLEFDFTYYQTNTKNQLFSLQAPTGSKYTTYYVNAGNIRNRGIEITLGGSPVWMGDFRWRTGVNFSFNRNKVLELAEGLGYFDFGGGGSNSYAARLEVGGSFGDLYGRCFSRDEEGKILYDEEGIPRIDKSDLKKVGNSSPDFLLGWQNTLTYKGFSLYFLFDGRFGGDVMSLTEAELDKYGVSKVTGDARNNGGVNFDGRVISDVERFYTMIGGRDGVTEHYVHSATNIRLRELSIGYKLPKKMFVNAPFIKDIEFSLIGRNLFFITNKAPYDPDLTLSTGNRLQSADVFSFPTPRSFGFNIKVGF